jgi:PAS domain S-box-containing protein
MPAAPIPDNSDATLPAQADLQPRLAEETKQILDSISSVLIGLDENNVVIHWNRAAEGVFGLAAVAVIGLPFRECPLKWNWDHLFYGIDECRRTGQMVKLNDVSYIKPNGIPCLLGFSINPICGTEDKSLPVTLHAADITERKRTELALLESEAKMRAIVETAADGIITIDEHGCIQSFNPAAERIFGYRTDEVIARNISMLMPEADAAVHDSYLAQHTDTGQRKILGKGREVMGKRKNGALFPIDITVSDVQQGGMRLFVGIVRDITERKEAEAMRRESEERLQGALRAGNLGTWDLNLSTGIVNISPTEEAHLGFKPGEFGGTLACFQQRIHPEDRNLVHAACTLAIEERIPLAIEFRVVWTDGSIHWLSSRGRCFYDEARQEVRLSGTSADITERKEAEATLASQRQLLDNVLAHIPHSVFWKDRNSVYLGCNVNFARDAGLATPEAIVGKTDYDLPWRQNEAAAYRELDYRVMNEGAAVLNVEETRTGDGSTATVLTSKVPLRDADGDVFGILGMYADITARKRMEEALALAVQQANQAARELEQRNWELVEARDAALAAARMKSEFLANTSHEVRTPLNGVLGMVNLLLNTELDASQRLYAQAVKQSAENLLGIINDILDFSKIEAGKMTLENAEFSLYEMVQETARLLAPRAHEKNLELCCDLPPLLLSGAGTPERVEGDPTRLRQILTNLLGNAIKFTHQGEIVIGVELLAESLSEVRWRLFVRDTGIGIPKDRQEAIFESFTQADGSTTRRFGGTGLGLTICQQLAALMGAEIAVASEYGLGSIFRLDITLKKQAYGTTIIDESSLPLDGCSIIVTDDNATQRGYIARLLRGWGCSVAEAANTSQAREVLHKMAEANRRCHAMLVDSGLIANDIHRFTAEMRALPTASEMRLLFLTPLGSRTPEANSTHDQHLFKPVIQRELFQWLTEGIRIGTPESDVGRPTTNSPQDSIEPLDPSTRILLAEDNAVNQMIMQHLIAQFGLPAAALTTVNNGREAVAAFDAGDYDLIFMDVLMPEMDGIEAAGIIREREKQRAMRRTPIIAMTALNVAADREQCLASGMDDFITKPAAPEHLIATIRRGLRAKAENSIRVVADDEPPAEQRGSKVNAAEAADLTWDRTQLAKVSGGNVALETNLMREFLNSGPKMLLRCRMALELEDAASIEHWAHTLKGSCRTLGIMHMAALCQQMETYGRDKQIEQAGESLTAIVDEWLFVEAQIRNWQSQHQTAA